MRLHWSALSLLALLFLVVLPPHARAVTFELTRADLPRTAIFIGGEPSITRSRDGGATSMDRFAAQELARYLGQALGATDPIPILSADRAVGWPIRIAIGGPKTNSLIRRLARGPLSSHVQDDQWTLLRDAENISPSSADPSGGFVILPAEDAAARILVLGGNLRPSPEGAEPSDPATLYAVYHFLERFAGCGFFQDGIRIPRLPRIVVDDADVEVPGFRDRCYRISLSADGPRTFSPAQWGEEEWEQCLRWMAQRKLNVALIDLSGREELPVLPPAVSRLAARQGVRLGCRLGEQAVSSALDRDALSELLTRVVRATGPIEYWVLPLPIRPEDEPEDLVYLWSDILSAVEAVSPGARCLVDASAWLRPPWFHAGTGLDPFRLPEGFLAQWLNSRRPLYVFDPFVDVAPWSPRASELDRRLRRFLPAGLELAMGVVHSFAQDQQIHGDLEALGQWARDGRQPAGQVALSPSPPRGALAGEPTLAAREESHGIVGFALLMEAPEHNYAYVDLAARLAWDPWQPRDLEEFLATYASLRFGGASAPTIARAEALVHEATRAYCLPFLFEDTLLPEATSTGRMFYRNLDGTHPEFFPLWADRDAWLRGREWIWPKQRILPRLARALNLYTSCAVAQRDNSLYSDSLVELCRTYLGELNNWHLAEAYLAYREATAALSSPSPAPDIAVRRFQDEAARALRCLTLLASVEDSDPRFSNTGAKGMAGGTDATGASSRLAWVSLWAERAYCAVLADRLRARRIDPLVSDQWAERDASAKAEASARSSAASGESPVGVVIRALGELAIDPSTGLDGAAVVPFQGTGSASALSFGETAGPSGFWSGGMFRTGRISGIMSMDPGVGGYRGNHCVHSSDPSPTVLLGPQLGGLRAIGTAARGRFAWLRHLA